MTPKETRRICLALDLVDDAELIAEYERWHQVGNTFPEVTQSIRDAGIGKPRQRESERGAAPSKRARRVLHAFVGDRGSLCDPGQRCHEAAREE